MVASKTQAIQTALMGDWQNAVTINQSILKEDPNDIETLNRLGFAFTVLGKVKEAKNCYKKVLTLDKQNPIAIKNLRRLEEVQPAKNGDKVAKQSVFPSTDIGTMFIEESGKTKVIELINIAQMKVIVMLRLGEALKLSIKRLKIYVLNSKKQYVGMLPADIAKRLIEFIKGGNEYIAFVKSIEERRVVIFVKEIKRAARFKNQPSFLVLGKGKTQTFDHTGVKDHAKPSEEESFETSEG